MWELKNERIVKANNFRNALYSRRIKCLVLLLPCRQFAVPYLHFLFPHERYNNPLKRKKKRTTYNFFMKPSLHYQFLHANIYSLISSNEFSYSLFSLKAGASSLPWRFCGHLVALGVVKRIWISINWVTVYSF